LIALAIFTLLAAQDLSTGTKAPAPGEILVATDKSHDPDLARSVIVLVHCDRDGAIGLIVNHPNGKAFDGGPVALGVRTLVRSKIALDHAEHVAGDLYLFDSMVERPGARVFAGYTGWSARQLKDEISRGLWKVLPADSSVVFDPSPATLWRRLAH
jgi:putative transcriptional regulator